MRHEEMNELAAPLWEKRPESQNDLVLIFQPLLTGIVNGYCRKNSLVDRDDCLGDAQVRLIQGVEKYDPCNENGASATTFLSAQLHFSTLDTARSNDNVPHSARSKDKAKAVSELPHVYSLDQSYDTVIESEISSHEIVESTINRAIDSTRWERHKEVLQDVKAYGIKQAAKRHGMSAKGLEILARQHAQRCR